MLLPRRGQPVLAQAPEGGPGLPGNQAEHTALRVAVLGVHASGEHGHLLQGLLVDAEEEAPLLPCLSPTVAVDQPHPVDLHEHLVLAVGVGHVTAPDAKVAVQRDAGLKLDQVFGLPRQRHGLDVSQIDDVSGRGPVRLDGRALGDHHHLGGLQRGLLQRKVDPRREVRLHQRVLLDGRGITDHRRGQFIPARIHRQDEVVTVVVGRRASPCAFDHNVGAWKRLACRVGDDAVDLADRAGFPIGGPEGEERPGQHKRDQTLASSHRNLLEFAC